MFKSQRKLIITGTAILLLLTSVSLSACIAVEYVKDSTLEESDTKSFCEKDADLSFASIDEIAADLKTKKFETDNYWRLSHPLRSNYVFANGQFPYLLRYNLDLNMVDVFIKINIEWDAIDNYSFFIDSAGERALFIHSDMYSDIHEGDYYIIDLMKKTVKYIGDEKNIGSKGLKPEEILSILDIAWVNENNGFQGYSLEKEFDFRKRIAETLTDIEKPYVVVGEEKIASMIPVDEQHYDKMGYYKFVVYDISDREKPVLIQECPINP